MMKVQIAFLTYGIRNLVDAKPLF